MRKESWFTAAVLWTLAGWFAHPAIAQQPAPANKEPAETLLQKAERMLLLQKAELALDQDTTLEFVDTPLNTGKHGCEPRGELSTIQNRLN